MSVDVKNGKIVALMPMKHKSERVPGKNFREFNGRPLFHWTLQTLLAVPEIDEVVVNTDSQTIKDEINQNFPAVKIIDRPEHLQGGDVPMNEILMHDAEKTGASILLQTHSTNPLLRPQSISGAINAFRNEYPKFDSLFSVTKTYKRFYDQLGRAINHNPAVLLNTQDLPPIMEENSCIYIFTADILKERRSRLGYRPQMYPISAVEAQDIDEEHEFEIAKVLHGLTGGKAETEYAQAATLDEAKGVTRLRPVPGHDYSKHGKVVLITAPHIMPQWHRFGPLLKAFGIECNMQQTSERMEAEDLLKFSGTYDGTICGDDYYTPEVVKAATPRLKVVSKWGTGIDSINQKACAEHGVMIGRTPNAFTEPVSDSVMAYMLHFTRNLAPMDKEMKAGRWRKIAGRSMKECILGIVGLGDIGMAVARKAQGFDMKVIGCDIREVDPELVKKFNIEVTDFETVLQTADFVSINCDLNETSYHLMNDKTFAMMKPSGIIINTARGPIIEEKALEKAILGGIIAGCGLDVFEFEPLPLTSPLRKLDNCIIAPHNSNSSPLAHENVHWNTLRNLFKGLEIPYEDYFE
eukprot:Clim_evm135s157 gene=Clim_evmTU135s157